MKKKEYSLSLGDKTLKATFSDMADQANGSVMVSMGGTSVFCTAVMGGKDKPEMSYFPLVVDYEEKFYAAGLILGGQYNKREGRPTDEAILSGRMIDRTIRPLFNHSMRRDMQVVATVISIDQECDPDILAIIGSSLAIAVSDIPWDGPVSAVRVGKIAGENLVLNPAHNTREGAELDVTVCGREDRINMVEAGALEVSEKEIDEVFTLAVENINKIQKFQRDIIKDIGKEKAKVSIPETPEELTKLYEEKFGDKELTKRLFADTNSKKAIETLEDEWAQICVDLDDDVKVHGSEFLHNKIDKVVHIEALKNDKRVDGRKFDEIRPLFAQAGGIATPLHGSGLFYRGATHVLGTLTLGPPSNAQTIEGMKVRGKKKFLHHYNFPPFSVGETGRMGGINRRSTGHGALAEKALSAVIPTAEEFPYTIRLVSESLASNGSTSMGSVCAGTLALMDGGVPIKNPVAGIAMGLMTEHVGEKLNYKILTDIQGPEDHHGDMDFKVAGTRDGITAIQMDVKVEGVPADVLSEAILEAKKARLQILDCIEKEIPKFRSELNPSAPNILRMSIKPEQIGSVIGSGGKVIKGIMETTGAQLDIEEDGSVFATGTKEQAEAALAEVDALTHEYKPGDEVEGEVVKILDFGCFVKLGPNAEGMVHISQLANFRIENINDYVCYGDKLPIVVQEPDEQGRTNYSVVKRDPNFFKEGEKKKCPPPPRGKFNRNGRR